MQKSFIEIAVIDDLTEIVATFVHDEENDIEFMAIKDSQAFPQIAPQEVTIRSIDDLVRLQAFIGLVLKKMDDSDEPVEADKMIGPEGISEDEINRMIKEAA